MRKIRTLFDLSESLDKELSWRKHELINLKLYHDQARSHIATMLRRAGIAILYAHFEGFVKAAGKSYVEYVSRCGVRFKDLRPGFVALGLKRELFPGTESARGSVLRELVVSLTNRADEIAELPWASAIQTKSNLTSERLRDIVLVLELDYRPFELRAKTIIDRLVDQRNHIAHGQSLEVDSDEFIRLHAEVMDMIEIFRTQIENAAQSGSFRRQVLDTIE